MIKWKKTFNLYSHHRKEVGILVLIVTNFFFITSVVGHGRLMEPPNRSSLWRLKEYENYKPEKNYDDNQIWCGGMGSQYSLSGGKCGPCGDEYVKPRPRENENGGKYGRGLITRIYKPGQVIQIGVELTVNHLGYFLFNLCPLQISNGGKVELEEEDCFDKYPLPLTDGTGFKFVVNSNDTGYYKTNVRLPKDIISCKLCTIRWHYRTGNRWNYVNNETGALGIGDQEIFRGCSDVSIGTFPPDPTTTLKPSVITTTMSPLTNPTTILSIITSTTATATANTSKLTTSQKPSILSTPTHPHHHYFPTQRPPTAAEIPTVSTVASTTTSTSFPSTNHHLHPVMRPPPSNHTKNLPNIIIPILIDSIEENNIL